MKFKNSSKAIDARSLLTAGASVRTVARRLQIPKSAVGRLRKEMRVDPPKSKAGRPAKLSAADKRYCVHAIATGKVETATAVARNLKSDLNVAVAPKTVRRALQEAGLGAVEKVSKPLLSKANIKKRLMFAKRHKHWTLDDWRRVIWSDESKVNRLCSDGRQWCWIRESTQLQDRQVKPTVKHGGGNIMVWGCITAEGPGFLCKIDNTLDQTLYKEILAGELQQTIDWYHLDKSKIIFQHDNDPKHTAKSVTEWLQQNEMDVLTWPPQSPDLNPIEHVWALLKRRLNAYERPASGMVELWERIQETWNAISKEDCEKVIESMPARIEALLKAKGRWTHY